MKKNTENNNTDKIYKDIDQKKIRNSIKNF